MRLLAAFLAGVVVAITPQTGLLSSRGLPGWADQPAESTQPRAEVGENQGATYAVESEHPLAVDPVTSPAHTLPGPYPQTSDQVRPGPSASEASDPASNPSLDDSLDDLENGATGDPAAPTTEAITAPAPDALPALHPDPATLESVDVEALLVGLDPEVAKRSRILIEADRLYLAGDVAAAQPLYRQAKESKWQTQQNLDVRVAPMIDPADLPPAGAVYWREAQAGMDAGLPTRVLVPLQLLVQQYPEFLPGQALYARYLVDHDRADEALAVLDAAVARYPYYPDLLRAQMDVQMAQEQWIEAAITAQQFVVLNPDHPDTPEVKQMVQDNLARFRGQMNQTLTSNLLANIITGAAGYILTGGLLGPFTAINSSMMLLQGESAIGAQVANQVRDQLPMVEDPEIRAYVNTIGQQLAQLAGRNEFNYSFEVIMDESLNAFALPGGKVFINAGALTKTNSEAELAGLIGHEVSHAVLSHGFQMMTQGNLTSSLAAFIPIPEVAGIAANLIVSGYSREMERQADILGTKILSSDQYAADGLYNLMVTLKAETDERTGVNWFATHPATDERIGYLKQLVDQGGFSRYAYEGVVPHLKIRQKMQQLLTDYQQQEKLRQQAR